MPDRPASRPARRDRAVARRGAMNALARLALLSVFATGAADAAAAEGPRLFTTPQERERLDALRAEATAEELARKPERKSEPEPAAVPEPPPRVHLRGFVRRSGGPEAVWVNEGSTLSGSHFGEGISAGRIEGSIVVVTLPDGRRVRLKPGQTWDPERGKVVDVAGD